MAHVWFQCYYKGFSKNAKNTSLDTNSNPNPNPNPNPDSAPAHINLDRENQFFLGGGEVGRP